MNVVIIPLLKYKSKDPADVSNYRPIAIATSLSKALEQVLPGTRILHTANLVSSEHMGQKCPCLHSSKQWIFSVIRTYLCTCSF